MAIEDNTTSLNSVLAAVNALPSGGGSSEDWTLLKTITVGDDVSVINITQDEDGNAISCKELRFVMLLTQVNTSLTLYFTEKSSLTNNRPSITPSRNVANQTIVGYFTKLGGYVGSNPVGIVRTYVGGYNYTTRTSVPVADGNMTGLYISSASSTYPIWAGSIIYLFGR